jgi:phosphatidylserine/phosphatidylglycerophosphate/cardiolipin synthase-like enzyme
MVGSCNIDPRSYLLCQEVAAVVDDAAYAAELRDLFLADEAQSLPVDPARWAQRPLGEKAMEQLARLAASQL